MKDYLILIPPSEGKAPAGTEPPLIKTTANIQHMIFQLNKINGGSEKILGVKAKVLEKAIKANQTILTAPTMPAIQRYTGVVYSAIDYGSLKAKAKHFFDKHVRIISALFGLVKPAELIPDYKLKIDKLGAQKHWYQCLKQTLKGRLIIDLLPQTHKKAINADNILPVEFTFMKNYKTISAGHQGKHIKGRFIRWMCEQQSCDPKIFPKFNEEGFRWHTGKFIKNV